MCEDYTRQVMNSGWDTKDTREMVVRGIRGWRRIIKRRIEENDYKYRSSVFRHT